MDNKETSTPAPEPAPDGEQDSDFQRTFERSVEEIEKRNGAPMSQYMQHLYCQELWKSLHPPVKS